MYAMWHSGLLLFALRPSLSSELNTGPAMVLIARLVWPRCEFPVCFSVIHLQAMA